MQILATKTPLLYYEISSNKQQSLGVFPWWFTALTLFVGIRLTQVPLFYRTLGKGSILCVKKQ